MPEQPAVARGAAQQAAQHIAAALVAEGMTPSLDHEGGGADVVGDDAQGHVGLFVLLVGDAGDARRRAS